MAGNVWEWVNDWYGESYYTVSPYSNPTGPSSGSWKVLCGGSYDNSDKYARVANRSSSVTSGYANSMGFRCAADPQAP